MKTMTYLLNLTMVVFCSQLFAAEDANTGSKESFISPAEAQAQTQCWVLHVRSPLQ